MSPGPKNGLESCVSRFSTICAKNQVLKLKIDKVTVIRVEQITLSGGPPLRTIPRLDLSEFANLAEFVVFSLGDQIHPGEIIAGP